MKTEDFYPEVRYQTIIAIKERSGGNETIGDMWLETRTFDRTTPVEDIMKWADNCGGKLILTWDESSIIKQ